MLGKTAYEAYCDAVGWRSYGGDPLPSWESQAPFLRDAWDAAARAVATVIEEHGVL